MIFPERTSAARVRCQVHRQQRTTENMPVEQQLGTESKHHLARTDKCSTCALSSASSTENNRGHASGAAARSPSIILPERTSAAQMRCQVHNQQRATENMSVEQQHGTESKHHLARTDRCSTSALSSASSTENNRKHASGAAARNAVQASSCQNGQVQHECVVKCTINREHQRTRKWSSSMERSPNIIFPEQKCSMNALSSASSTENNREQARGAAARNGVQASSCQNGQVQHECAVKCIIDPEQERTCQWSSMEQSASIILPERTGAPRVRCQVHHRQ